MDPLILPKNYESSLDVIGTQRAIKQIKDFFEKALADKLHLTRVSAPLFVRANTGFNDNLTGVERPVTFSFIDGDHRSQVEIVQSLAKWKRIALAKYKIKADKGIYTDMDAIRPNEICDNTHSLYVDQWDWEKVIHRSNRNIEYLKEVVNNIYQCFLDTETMLANEYERYEKILPENITFIDTQELLNIYPDKNPDEREYHITKKHKAVFLLRIGHPLSNGIPHDQRSPDYDDWKLNGDLLLWNPILESHLELSSMGIRVDQKSLIQQLSISDCNDRLKLDYHTMLTSGKLPLTIGGGIGQSRICMYFLQKAHIGEVQASIWPEYMIRACENHGIHLL